MDFAKDAQDFTVKSLAERPEKLVPEKNDLFQGPGYGFQV